MYIYTLYAGILLLFPFFLLPYFIKFSHDNFSLLSWLSQCLERNRKHEKHIRESVNRWITWRRKRSHLYTAKGTMKLGSNRGTTRSTTLKRCHLGWPWSVQGHCADRVDSRSVVVAPPVRGWFEFACRWTKERRKKEKGKKEGQQMEKEGRVFGTRVTILFLSTH